MTAAETVWLQLSSSVSVAVDRAEALEMTVADLADLYRRHVAGAPRDEAVAWARSQIADREAVPRAPGRAAMRSTKGRTTARTSALIFPMTAGDLVQSVQIVSIGRTGSGPEVVLLEVLDVEQGPGFERVVTVRNPHGGEPLKLTLEAQTPLLVTGISRR